MFHLARVAFDGHLHIVKLGVLLRCMWFVHRNLAGAHLKRGHALILALLSSGLPATVSGLPISEVFWISSQADHPQNKGAVPRVQQNKPGHRESELRIIGRINLQP